MAAPLVNVSDLKMQGGTASPNSNSFTIGGANRVLYCFVVLSDGSPGTVSSVSWGGGGGEALTAIADSGVVQSYLRCHVYRKIAPTAATSTVSVTLGASTGEIGIYCVSIEDCDQTTPNGTVTFANGNGVTPDPTLVVSSATGKLVIDCLGRFAGNQTVGAGQTQLQQGNFGSILQTAASREAGAASTSMTWSDLGFGTVSNWEWVLAGMSLNEVAAGGTTLMGQACL